MPRKQIGVGLLVTIVALSIVGGLVWSIIWNTTHYTIEAGKVGIVVDQIGGVVRVEKGPRGFAEKATWETVIYFDIRVRTEEMLSPAEEVNGTTVMHPEPLAPCRYGAVVVNSIDGIYGIYIDIAIQWHLDTETLGWQERIAKLYLQYPAGDFDTATIYPGVREFLRSYAGKFAMDALIYTDAEVFADGSTEYVQRQLDKIPTLYQTVVIDKIFIRKRMPPPDVQRMYLTVRAAQKQAEAILTIANATRDASIRVAEGQSMAIELVVNATTEAMQKLLTQNMTSSEAIQYLGLQYTFDSLKAIAKEHPEWKLTLFLNTPQVTYTIPISPED